MGSVLYVSLPPLPDLANAVEEPVLVTRRLDAFAHDEAADSEDVDLRHHGQGVALPGRIHLDARQNFMEGERCYNLS